MMMMTEMMMMKMMMMMMMKIIIIIESWSTQPNPAKPNPAKPIPTFFFRILIQSYSSISIFLPLAHISLNFLAESVGLGSYQGYALASLGSYQGYALASCIILCCQCVRAICNHGVWGCQCRGKGQEPYACRLPLGNCCKQFLKPWVAWRSHRGRSPRLCR